ncbi:MAG: hypothetical protein ABH851_03845 [Methanobacteriota archaeon]
MEEKVLPLDEQYRMVGRLMDELRVSDYSRDIGRLYITVVKDFLKKGLSPREYMLENTWRNRSIAMLAYNALRFFYTQVLDTGFEGASS